MPRSTRWLVVLGIAIGALIAMPLPLLAEYLGWQWFDNYWQNLSITLGIGIVLGLLFWVLQLGVRQEVRWEALRRPATELAQTTEPSQGQEGDIEAPVLRHFDMHPRTVDVTDGPAEILLSAHLTDEMAGVAGEGYTSSPTQVRIASPSARQFVDGCFEAHRQLVDGDALDGRYESRIAVPRFSETGTWKVVYFLLVDQVGNARRMTEPEMREAGFPTELVVRSYRPDPRAFAQRVIRAIERIGQESDRPWTVTIDTGGRDPSHDAEVETASGMVAVEVLYSSRTPIAAESIRSARAFAGASRPPLLIVSNASPSEEAINLLSSSTGMAFVTWLAPSDDEELRKAVRWLQEEAPPE